MAVQIKKEAQITIDGDDVQTLLDIVALADAYLNAQSPENIRLPTVGFDQLPKERARAARQLIDQLFEIE